jgi:hypothetical protein
MSFQHLNHLHFGDVNATQLLRRQLLQNLNPELFLDLNKELSCLTNQHQNQMPF